MYMYVNILRGYLLLLTEIADAEGEYALCVEATTVHPRLQPGVPGGGEQPATPSTPHYAV